MYCKAEPKDFRYLKDGNIAWQTGYWARVKQKEGERIRTFSYKISADILNPAAESTGRMSGNDLLLLIKYFDREHCIAYVPYGPKDEPFPENHGVFLEALSEALRPYLPKGCVALRFDLPWENQWALEDDYYDSEGNWIGQPAPEYREMRLNYKTHNGNLAKSRSDILPANTIFLEIRKNDDELLKRMKSKTRYNIRLALRHGIQVDTCGPEMLDTWYDLYHETAGGHNIRKHDKAYFYSVLTADTSDLKSDVETRLLMARHEDQYLAAMFLLLSKNRGTYLYGASSREKRRLMPTYALQWEAVKQSRAAGCAEYDMFGTAPDANSSHPMHGLYRFKKGFGGIMFHRMGCWDYICDQKGYRLYRALEINNQSYHLN